MSQAECCNCELHNAYKNPYSHTYISSPNSLHVDYFPRHRQLESMTLPCTWDISSPPWNIDFQEIIFMQPSLLKYHIKLYPYSKIMHIPVRFYWKLNVLLCLAKCLNNKGPKKYMDISILWNIFVFTSLLLDMSGNLMLLEQLELWNRAKKHRAGSSFNVRWSQEVV